MFLFDVNTASLGPSSCWSIDRKSAMISRASWMDVEAIVGHVNRSCEVLDAKIHCAPLVKPWTRDAPLEGTRCTGEGVGHHAVEEVVHENRGGVYHVDQFENRLVHNGVLLEIVKPRLTANSGKCMFRVHLDNRNPVV